MKITELGLRRPVTVSMIFFALILLGVISFTNLSVDLLPDMSFPIVFVVASYEGAGPAEIESMLAKPLEKAISTIPNLKSVSSSSMEGAAGILAELENGADVDKAANNIREKIDLVKDYLPDKASDPMIIKMDPSMIPVLVLGVSSANMNLRELRAFANDDLSPKLQRVEGVASTTVSGGLDRQIRVNIDRAALEARSLSLEQVQGAIAAANLNQPGGRLSTAQADFTVRTTGQFNSVAEIGKIIVGSGYSSSALPLPIFLRDIATISDASADKTSSTLVNGFDGVMIQVQKASGANTVKVANSLLKALTQINKELPAGVKVNVLMDTSTSIRQSIESVQREIMIGGVLAILIILLFLANITSTAIISIAIPIALIVTFSLLYFGKMSLNIATLGGLALGIGRLVDDSIVVLENIYRHMQAGENPIQASLKGTSEVGMAVIASTITTIAVFVPILFVEGMAALIFKPMAYTVSFALLASMFVSLMLTPLLTSRFLKLNEGTATFMGRWKTRTDRGLNGLDNAYHAILRWALQRRKTVIVLVVLLFISMIFPLIFVQKEFMPNGDSGQIAISIKLPVGAQLKKTIAVQDQIYQIFKQNVPEIKNCYARIGVDGSGMSAIQATYSGISGPNAASMTVNLKSITEGRKRSTDQIIELVRSKTRNIPDAQINFSSASMMSGGGMSSTPIQVEIYGFDLATGKKLADQIQKVIQETPNTADVKVSLEMGVPELQIKIDNFKAAALGLSVSQVATAVNTQIGGATASLFRDPATGKEYNIQVQLAGNDRERLNDLEQVVLSTAGGQHVALSNVATIVKGIGPVKIDRRNQDRIITVTARTFGRAPGTVAEDVQRSLSRKVIAPQGFSYKMTGSLQDQNESFASLGFALLLAVALLYMVLASQFESLVDPFIIMFSVPLGLIGVAWGLFLTGSTLSTVSLLGIIMMAGIVVSNGILLVDYTNQLRERGMELFEAVATAGRTRLRPVLMTTLTTMLGLIPMAMGIGEGSEMEAPMGVTVISGLIVSTVMTLVFIPILYTIVETRFRRRKKSDFTHPVEAESHA